MHETELSLSYQSVRTANRVRAALKPEVGEIAGDRTAVELCQDSSELTIRLQATDPVALRAGQNTWLGFVAVTEEVLSVAERFTAD